MSDLSYAEFVAGKSAIAAGAGIDDPVLPYGLFEHQDLLTTWALARGRAAVFADTGLGKTRIEAAWSSVVHNRTGADVLILAPLAVAEQTVREGLEIGVPIKHVRDGSEAEPGISITNYDRLHRFDPRRFGAVVLDESSIIKNHDSRTLSILMESFAHCQYKLACTATPSPNDYTELGTHAEFLGIRTRAEMLSEFFVHDGGETQKWRLKGHARVAFWEWVASWGALIQLPSDIDCDDSGYILPPLHHHAHEVEAHAEPDEGMLFALEASTLTERRSARRNSTEERCAACADLVRSDNEPWIVWCDFNAESERLAQLIPGAVEIRGSDSIEHKERSLVGFGDGSIRVLVTKPSIAGHGLNWQHCRNVAFSGLSDSYEQWYQAVRRCWRFGQQHEVHVHMWTTQTEGAVLANLDRKGADARAMAAQLRAFTRDAVRAELTGDAPRYNDYAAHQALALPAFMR